MTINRFEICLQLETEAIVQGSHRHLSCPVLNKWVIRERGLVDGFYPLGMHLSTTTASTNLGVTPGVRCVHHSTTLWSTTSAPATVNQSLAPDCAPAVLKVGVWRPPSCASELGARTTLVSVALVVCKVGLVLGPPVPFQMCHPRGCGGSGAG